jgi:predicted extracellular nuclease
LAGLCQAQVAYGSKDTLKVATTNYNGEIIPWVVIGEVTVIDRRTFKSKEEFDKYRRLRYNVLKVLPYARFAGQRYRQLEKDLALTSDKRKQKQLIKSCDKEIKDLFNDKIKNLTISQGEILIKLVDRETGNSSYDLVKDLKGNVSAFVVQSVAKIFGHDLRSKYDVDQEMDIEGIIHSVGYYSYQ